MAQGKPLPGEKYLHFKNRLYQVIAVAYHSETMERFVVYQALYGDFKVYIRPYNMFVSEVDHEKYPEVVQKYRFRYIDDVADEAGDSKVEEAGSGVGDGKADKVENGAGDGKADKAGSEAGDGRVENGREMEDSINPWLSRFLDADDFHEKYKVVCDMHPDVTDRLIDDIAVVMDVVIPEGKLTDRYAQLKYCVRTRQKYEFTRLR